MADNCKDCGQKERNDEQDKRLLALEKSSMDRGEKLAVINQKLEDKELVNGELKQSDKNLDEKITKTEQSLEEKVDAKLKVFEQKLETINQNFDKKMEKIDQKLWGFIIAVFLLILGVLYRGG
jgi:DNA repair exonuclease SbcCD ATPase subunit